MDKLALDLTIKCFETQDPYLDLGMCGLTDEDFIVGSPLDLALRKCTHIEEFVLSNIWYDWKSETGAREERHSVNNLSKNYFTIHPPAFEELHNLSSLTCGGDTYRPWLISDITFVNGFKKIKRLNISCNRIIRLKSLNALTTLQAFDISYNEIKVLWLNSLSALQEFNISNNQITELQKLDALPTLQKFNIANNKISELKGLSFLASLQEFNIANNQISELKGLDALNALKIFNISDNQITELKELDTLISLQRFYISTNQITELKGLEALTNLQIFEISGNRISELQGLNALRALQKFDVYNNRITELKGLDALTALQEFDISENQITELKGLNRLTALREFAIYNNHITELRGLDALNVLQKIFISGNQITELKGLDALTTLQELHISSNQITELKGLDALTALQILDISENQIEKIKGLRSLNALKAIDISGNKVTDITPLLKPYLLRKEFPLKVISDDGRKVRPGEINVEDNPIRFPPMEIVYQGNDAIIYWCEAQDQGKTVNRETKVILFGNGRGGKTTLSLSLRKNKFVPLTEKDRTHGILIETWNIPEKDLPVKLKEKIAENIRENNMRSPVAMKSPESFQIHLWDFGGQEYYHSTHRLFMSNNILYLLVWETATDNQYANTDRGQFDYPVSYWQKNINHFAPQNITLCVQNKVKKHADRTDNLHYRIEWRDKNNEGSIKRFENDIEVLKEGILENLADLSYIGDLAPQVYNEIRQALRKVESPVISYEDYKKLCEANDTTPGRIMQDDAQKETLIRFLDDTGVLVCFSFRKGIDSPALKEYVFTDPVWLTEIIYNILEKGKAEFDEQHVEEIVSQDRLDAAVWIEIMKQFELIFEIEKRKKKKYVVPQYLPDTYANQDAYDMALAGKKMEHAFTLNYPDFLPRSNFLRLLAKYGRQNISYLYWKSGMVFFLNNKTVFAKCAVTAEERKIIISIQDRDEKATKEIFETLIAIDAADELQVSINEKEFVEVKKLKEKIFKGNKEIDSLQDVTLSLSEFKILFNLESEKSTTRQVFISYAHDDIEFKKELQTFLVNIERDGLIEVWQDESLNAGDNWDNKIKEAMGSADICILLLSQSLINSSYSHETEFKTIMERRAAGTTMIIPVLIKDCDWKHWKVYPDHVASGLAEDEIKNYSIGTFQFLPIDDKKRVKPLNQWRFKEKAWKQVGDAIRKFCESSEKFF